MKKGYSELKRENELLKRRIHELEWNYRNLIQMLTEETIAYLEAEFSYSTLECSRLGNFSISQDESCSAVNQNNSYYSVPKVSCASQQGQRNELKKVVPATKTKDDLETLSLMKVIRKALAEQTMTILRTGRYTSDEDGSIDYDISAAINEAVKRTVCYPPDEIILTEFPVVSDSHVMVVEVVEEDALSCCRRLFDENPATKIGCLSFASGKYPGGKFLAGSRGQEESIARSSAYYLCVAKHAEVYDFNRSLKDPLNSNHIIVADDTPVFRSQVAISNWNKYRI